jgi:hypothetical protein
MGGLDIADLNREVTTAAELSDDLLVEPALVVPGRQEQVGALLGGELKKAGEVCNASAWIGTPSSSRVLKGFEGRALVGRAGIKRGLGDRYTELPGIERDLSDEPSCTIGVIQLSG